MVVIDGLHHPLPLKTSWDLNADDATANINSLDSLLASKGLDIGDFITAIDAIAKIKARDPKKLDKEEAEEQKKQKKTSVDKELVYEPERMCLYTEIVEWRVVDTMQEYMIQEPNTLRAKD